MISVRAKKILRDLTANRSRTALVVLSIAVGIFATGAILGARQVLLREFDTDFAQSDRASVTFTTTDVSSGVISQIKNRSDVVRVSQRRVITGRVRPLSANPDAQVNTNGWTNLEIDALGDFNAKPGRILKTNARSWPPKKGEIILEGGTNQSYDYKIGQTVEVETSSGTAKLRVVGFAHDLNAIPALFYRQITGYVSLDTLPELGQQKEYNTILVDVDPALNRADAARVGNAIRTQVLEPAGVTVERMSVPEPGTHFFGNIFKGVSVLLLAMALMALALSGFLVITTTSAILIQQTRQLGIMKAIGADRHELTWMYVGLVACFGVLGVAVGLPFGILFGDKFIAYAAGVLNFHVYDSTYPTWVIVTLVVIGVVVPVIAAAVPIRQGVKRSIVDAFNATSLPGFNLSGPLDRLLAKIHGLPRPTALALRSTFARKGRLAMTLMTLVLASGVVMAVFSARASLLQTVDNVGTWWNYSASVKLAQPTPSKALERLGLKQTGVTHAETWLDGRGVIERPDGTTNEAYFSLGYPADTQMIDFDYTSGHPLRAGAGEVVLNTELANDESYLEPGDKIYLEINGNKVERTVAGIVTGSLQGPYMFFDRDDLANLMGIDGAATRLVVTSPDAATSAQQQVLAKKLETAVTDQGYQTSSTETQIDQLGTTKSQLGILITFLIIMASALALVGVISLSGSMMLTVIESTREIGVMRSIGAQHRSIFGIYITQGLVVGTISWAGGALLSWPLSYALMQALITALGMPLAYRFSWGGVVLWLLCVWIISILGSILPAWRASQVAIRDAISYE